MAREAPAWNRAARAVLRLPAPREKGENAAERRRARRGNASRIRPFARHVRPGGGGPRPGAARREAARQKPGPAVDARTGEPRGMRELRVALPGPGKTPFGESPPRPKSLHDAGEAGGRFSRLSGADLPPRGAGGVRPPQDHPGAREGAGPRGESPAGRGRGPPRRAHPGASIHSSSASGASRTENRLRFSSRMKPSSPMERKNASRGS